MVVRLRKSIVSRLVVRILVALFLMFGATFIPTRVSVSSGGDAAEMFQLHGADAARYLEARTRQNVKLRAAMAKVRQKPGVYLDGQVVHVTRSVPPSSLAMTLLEPLVKGVSAFAEDIVHYADEAVIVYTPYEGDSNPDTAEFSVYTQDYETGATRTGEVIVWTYEAAYGNPDAAIDVLDVSVECASAPAAIASSLAAWLAPGLQAQTSHEGASCNDEDAQKLRGRQDVKDAIKNGLIAAGTAAIPCIGFAHGWIVCVGAAFVGAASASISWDTAAYIWNCRCTFFGWDCDSEPPPI